MLGDDALLNRLSTPIRRRLATRTLEEFVNEICATNDLNVELVRSSKQDRDVTKARALIAARAIDEQIATLGEVARYLNRSASALSRAMDRYASRS